jgi:hypothetical protein
MNCTTPIHRSAIHRQSVKALELVEAEAAEQHCEILHLSSWIHVIISNIAQVNCNVHQNEKMLVVPVRRLWWICC